MNSEENKEKTILNRRNFLKLGILSTAAVLSPNSVTASGKDYSGGIGNGKIFPPIQKYVAKKYDSLLGNLKGISDSQLKAHFGLYENYINKINDFEAKIKSLDPNKANPVEYRGWHVDQTFMLNGAVLHEFYFGNLGSSQKEPNGNLKKMIDRDFGNLQTFISHMTATGKVMRGWSLAAYNYRTGRLNVYGLDQHNQLVPTMVYPLLVLDVYEHAYMIDYGTDRKKYLDAFVLNINWEPVQQRLEKALSISFGEQVTA